MAVFTTTSPKEKWVTKMGMWDKLKEADLGRIQAQQQDAKTRMNNIDYMNNSGAMQYTPANYYPADLGGGTGKDGYYLNANDDGIWSKSPDANFNLSPGRIREQLEILKDLKSSEKANVDNHNYLQKRSSYSSLGEK